MLTGKIKAIKGLHVCVSLNAACIKYCIVKPQRVPLVFLDKHIISIQPFVSLTAFPCRVTGGCFYQSLFENGTNVNGK